MKLQGMSLDLLQTVADLQEEASVEVIEDVQLAEAVELEISLVQNRLKSLAESGYVQLDLVERLAGIGYHVTLTAKGRDALNEAKA